MLQTRLLDFWKPDIPLTQDFYLTVRVCSPLITKQASTHTVRLFLTAFITLKACLHHPAFYLCSPSQDWCYYLIKGGGVCSSGGKRKRGREGGGGRGGRFPLTGWQPTGHRAYLSLAAGLSAGPVNLPDRSLQVPLIPLIQFILLTARMRPLSAGKIKPSLHSRRVSLCCPRDGKANPLSLTWRWKV